MRIKGALVRIGIGAVAILVTAAAVFPFYLRYSWERTRRDIATFAEADVAEGEMSVTVHVPKLSNAELDSLAKVFSEVSDSYYGKRLVHLWARLDGSSRVRGDKYAYQAKVLGVSWSWEDAAASFRYTLSCPAERWPELDLRVAEIEEIFLVATAQMEGARVIVRKGKQPNQALQTTPMTRSEI